MSFDYNSLEEVSRSEIEDKGRAVDLNYITRGTFNPQNATTSGASTTTVIIDALFTDYRSSQIDGTVIQQGDKLVLIAASGVTQPSLSDTITDTDGAVYTIKNIDVVQPGPRAILYKVQVRR